MSVFLNFTEKYLVLTPEDRSTFHQDNLKSDWYPSSLDLNFPHLSDQEAKQYQHGEGKVIRIDYN